MNPLAGCMSNLWRREHNYAVSFADLDSAFQSDSIGCGIESMWHKFLNCSLGEYLPATTGRYGSKAAGQRSKIGPMMDRINRNKIPLFFIAIEKYKSLL
jgi:hypothetical protein